MKKYFAELMGTFALVLFGTGAIVISDIYPDAISHLGVSIAFGTVVMAMIYTLGHISGAHINPAVSIGFYFHKSLSLKNALLYSVFQIIGAVLGSFCLSLVFPNNIYLGATIPDIGILQCFILEFVLTFILMLSIVMVSSGKYRNLTGVVVGAVVMLEALVFGPVTGASMNPARSIGPALVTGQIFYLWVYIFAPLLGASLAVVVAELFGRKAKN